MCLCPFLTHGRYIKKYNKINPFRPLTGGADQDKEEKIDYKCVQDGYDGAFGDGDTWGLQLTYRNIRVERTLSLQIPKRILLADSCIYGNDNLTCWLQP